MAKPFKFKQFTVQQDKCAMKIGTDGVLLGAWTSIESKPNSILDIGTGTGIIALQLAQRSDAELIDALEIEADAYEQAVENFENSNWSDRLFCYHASLNDFASEVDEKYDLIVSNPPFFTPPLPSTSSSKEKSVISDARNNARFTSSLSFDELLLSVSQLLSKNGTFSVIIPFDKEQHFIELAENRLLFPIQICRVKGNETSKIKRSLLSFSFYKKPPLLTKLTIEVKRHQYTKEYLSIVNDFYLHL